MNKQAIRSKMIHERRKISESTLFIGSQQIIKTLTVYIEALCDIAIYLPIQNELSLLSLTELFPHKNWYCPIWHDTHYQFYKLNIPIKTLNIDPFGVTIPDHTPHTAPSIQAYCIPGLAFDQNGSRIGFGKGIYDRLLMQQSGLKIGIAYDWQLLSEISTDSHDILMDLIITPTQVIHCSKTTP